MKRFFLVLLIGLISFLKAETQYTADNQSITTYDTDGNKILEQHPIIINNDIVRYFTIQWTYDANQRMTGLIEEPAQPWQKKISYLYNNQNQLCTTIKPNGIQIFYEYDEQGRLKTLKDSANTCHYCYYYDDHGRLYHVEDLLYGCSVHRNYNDLHQLTDETLGVLQVRNTYDAMGRRIAYTLPDLSSICYSYKGLLVETIERLTSEGNTLYKHVYEYDPSSYLLLRSYLIKDIGTINFSYDIDNHLNCVQSPWGSYTEENDNAQQTFFLMDQKIPHVITYTEQQAIDSEISDSDIYTYTYDSLGNRLSQNGKEWHVNSLNQLIQTPSARYNYDACGNLAEKQLETTRCVYTYDSLDRLICFIQIQQQRVDYHYDAFSRRLSETIYQWDDALSDWKMSGHFFYLYDGDCEIGKLNADGQWIELRVLSRGTEINSTIAIELPSGLYAPLHDPQGSIYCLIDTQTGQIAAKYDYSTYGVEKNSSTHSIFNPWRYFGKRYDPLTGFIYFGKRYYDPLMGRWITPDVISFCDAPNLYLFASNNPLRHYDLQGFCSLNTAWDYTIGIGYQSINDFFRFTYSFQKAFWNQWNVLIDTAKIVKDHAKNISTDSVFFLLDDYLEETEVGCYGREEIHPQVRVTFINGILTTQEQNIYNLRFLSQTHGDTYIHYIFRPTEGWMWDITRAIPIKIAFALGFRSIYAHLLAQTWKQLIEEMGGVHGGGKIIHYAHSLGGSDTDRARDLLTPEEQKMIQVYSFGSSTMIRNQGYVEVTNYVSLNDGVSYLDPLGRTRNLFDPHTNVIFRSQLGWIPFSDHVIGGVTYKPIIEELGALFVEKYGNR